MSDPFEMMAAVNTVRQAYWKLPERVHGEEPRDVYSRVLSATSRDLPMTDMDAAVHLAGLAVALVAALDRAELVRVDTGGEAA